jgi:hypothetical protein
MQEMDAEPVDPGRELRKPVKARLAATPIVPIGPIAANLVNPFQRRALAPIVD